MKTSEAWLKTAATRGRWMAWYTQANRPLCDGDRLPDGELDRLEKCYGPANVTDELIAAYRHGFNLYICLHTHGDD